MTFLVNGNTTIAQESTFPDHSNQDIEKAEGDLNGRKVTCAEDCAFITRATCCCWIAAITVLSTISFMIPDDWLEN